MIWTSALPYFSEAELACKGTGVIKLDLRFAAALPALRVAWGRPLSPASVCRAPLYNEAVKGHPNSLHLTDNPTHPTHGTMAADIAWRNWPAQQRLQFARLAYSLGWSVGLHDGFCHVDLRKALNLPNLPQAVFLYGSNWSGFSREEVF
jgi:hypothetical protein